MSLVSSSKDTLYIVSLDGLPHSHYLVLEDLTEVSLVSSSKDTLYIVSLD